MSDLLIMIPLWVIAAIQLLRLGREAFYVAHEWWANRWYLVKGKQLDHAAWVLYGLKRRVFESDSSLRRRCSNKWHEIDERINHGKE